MNDFGSTYNAGSSSRTMDMALDTGLRSFMLGVYNKMAVGLLVTAAIAFAVGTITPLTQTVLTAPVVFIVQFGPIALLLGSMFIMRNPSPTASGILYWAIVALIGAGMGVWVFSASQGVVLTTASGATMAPTMVTIAQAFGITATAFLALSIFGYTTKRNLTAIHSFLIMAIWGVLLIGIVNYFLKSSFLEMGIQLVALVLFAGLTASQTQMLKVSYYQVAGDGRSMAVLTNMGALNLYLAFINMFQIILSLLSRE